jgi:ABC-type Fe3+ transport system substrate-binding protein
LDNEDLDEAEKLIHYALRIKGIDKARILIQKSLLFEIRLEYKKALEPLKEARKYSYNQAMIDFLKSREKFIKSKMTETKKKGKK